MWIIPTENKGLLAILNSRLGWWLITKYCTQIQNGYQLIWQYFGNIPIAEPTAALSGLAEKMLSVTSELQKSRELSKQKLPPLRMDPANMKSDFTTASDACRKLRTEIEATGAEIDRLVYAIYGLTDEEIKIVEGKV